MSRNWPDLFMAKKHQYRINIDADLFGTLTQVAHERHVSINQLITDSLAQMFANQAPLVIGYIKIDRLGDLAIGDDCPVCTEPAQSWWLQVASNGETHHMCGQCATSE